MEVDEIKDVCIKSSKVYYQYLADNKKGRAEIKVNGISKIQNTADYFKLNLSGKLFDTDLILFYHIVLDKEFDNSIIKIKEYDSDNNVLIVRQSENAPFDLNKTEPEDILVISDLKFLIKRIQEFFENNGKRLKLPQKNNGTECEINDFRFLPEHQPNTNQKQALLTIFNNPFSYIWGAPGTGKTKFVLAYSIIKYIEQKKKVAIFAPTNLSLEQVLRGILEITDEAGIKRDLVIRIGNPTKKFAKDYPEVCEEAGIEKKIKEVKNQIRILENILGVDNFSNDQRAISEFNSHLKTYQINSKTVDKLKKEIKIDENKYQGVKNKYGSIKTSINSKEITILRKEHSLSSFRHKLIKKIKNGRTKLELKIEILDKELNSLYFQKADIEKVLKERKDNLSSKKAKLWSAERKIDESFASIEDLKFEDEKLKSIFLSFNEFMIVEINNELNDAWEEIKKDNPINESLKENYNGRSLAELKAKLEENNAILKKLNQYDTKERLKSTQIIGATLDGHIGRFSDGSLYADHYFIDEAGYANTIKTLSVFIYGKPITLLGDHMQLPPVFDMDERNQEYINNPSLYLFKRSSIFTDHVFNYSLESFIVNDEYKPITTVKTDLNITHRFGQNLAEILDRFVYGINFKSSNNTSNTKISYLHADKSSSIKKRDNQNEIKAIEKYLLNYNPSNFSILTPYNEQVYYLKQKFPRLYGEEKLSNIHKAQGREWDTVIFSVCDTKNKFFVDSTLKVSNGKNLINTAISRAIKHLIIVCDYNYWKTQRGQLIQGLLSIAEKIEV